VPQAGYILIVESDDLIRDLLERWLGEAGYRVVANSSTAPAARGGPSLVIANVPSPRGAGALIRSLQEKYTAPIIVVSARFRSGLGASKDAARRLRVRGVLPKPFTRAELLGAVRECLGDR
jgi:DNA-binding response OmpR family regulator